MRSGFAGRNCNEIGGFAPAALRRHSRGPLRSGGRAGVPNYRDGTGGNRS